MTTSARPSSSAPRRVSRPGSPGPAPTSETLISPPRSAAAGGLGNHREPFAEVALPRRRRAGTGPPPDRAPRVDLRSTAGGAPPHRRPTPSCRSGRAERAPDRCAGARPVGVGPDRQRAPTAQLGQEGPLGLHQRPDAGSSMAARASRVAASSARHSTASAPWPTWGTIASGSRTSTDSPPAGTSPTGRWPPWPPPRRPPRRTPTAASRVARLPRRPVKVRSGRRLASCARRRAEPVATVDAGGQCVEPAADQHVPGIGPLGERGQDQAGHGQRRRRRAGPWPSARRRRPRPATTAACTSLTKTPWPPSCSRGTSGRRSPSVSTTTRDAVHPRSAEQRRPPGGPATGPAANPGWPAGAPTVRSRTGTARSPD